MRSMIEDSVKYQKHVILMNRFDKRIAITPEKVAENLKLEVVAVIPLDERVVIPSVNRGIPFVLDNKMQPSARGVFTLAEVLRAKLMSVEGEGAEKVIRR